MGIIQKPQFAMHWSQDNFLHTPIFPRLMRRTRSEQIRHMIHFVNPLLEDGTSLPKSKVYSLSTPFQRNYRPTKHIFDNEYLSLWKERLKFRMYIPSKRKCFGIKVYMLCESSTGSLYNFIVYTGADITYPDPGLNFPKGFDDYSNPSKLALSLMKNLYNQSYAMVLDNLYTSPEFFLLCIITTQIVLGPCGKRKVYQKIFGRGNAKKVVWLNPSASFATASYGNIVEQVPEEQGCEICFHGFRQAYKEVTQHREKEFPSKREDCKARCDC